MNLPTDVDFEPLRRKIETLMGEMVRVCIVEPLLRGIKAELAKQYEIEPPPTPSGNRARGKSEADPVAAVPSPAATFDHSSSIPPGSAAESSLPPGMIVIRGTGNVINETALRADWLVLSTAAIMAKHKISEPTLYALRKRLALPDRPKGPRHKAPGAAKVVAPSPPPESAVAAKPRAAFATPAIGGGTYVPPPPKPRDSGIVSTPFDETGPTSIDAVIKFLRGRDVMIQVQPDGKFRVEGTRILDRDAVLAMANRKRALMNKPAFVLEG